MEAAGDRGFEVKRSPQANADAPTDPFGSMLKYRRASDHIGNSLKPNSRSASQMPAMPVMASEPPIITVRR